MVKITERLLRQRAEHNNLEIYSLEEVSLHQQDIERIEFIDKLCRDLKILYLQSNLIPKIENVGRLKKLEYLNLALNNIEKVENLEGCESLTKLDLTVNFVGELTSIETLKDHCHLKELFLTGNPCAQYEGYRDFVLATLPQITALDGLEIEKSERIKACQNYEAVREKILEQEKQYAIIRENQKEEAKIEEEDERIKEERKKNKGKSGFDGRWYTDVNKSDEKSQKDEEDEEEEQRKEKEFWDEKTDFTPESRIKVHKHMEETKKKKENKTEEPKKERRLFADDGRPLNVNEPKVDFTLTEDDACVCLDVACYRFLDTSSIDLDVQPNYVRLKLKGNVFQLCLDEEVKPDSSSAKRSQTSGHLVITMPKLNPVIKAIPVKSNQQKSEKKNNKENQHRKTVERLEVDESVAKTVDITNIVPEKKSEDISAPLGHKSFVRTVAERPNSEDFIDDPDVPPLM